MAAGPGWLLARLAVGLGFLVALATVDELQNGDRTLQLDQGLFAWDAAFYRDIAEHGYAGVAQEGLRFFPLLPLAARALSVPLLGNVGLALIVLVNAAALGAGVLLYRLTLVETGDRQAANRAAWLLALLPPAAVLVLGYAEAPMLLFTIGAFLAVRGRQRPRWWLAGVLGLLAGLTRPTAVALTIPMAIEVARDWRTSTPRRAQLLGRLAAIVGPVVGTGVYLAWVEREHGDGLLPIRLQNVADLRGGWANPITTVVDAVRGLGGSERLGEGLHVPAMVVFALLLVVALRRLPVSYGAYAAVLVVVAIAGESLGSFERYGLVAFPLVMALALLARSETLERAALAVCAMTLTGFATLAFLGAFVP